MSATVVTMSPRTHFEKMREVSSTVIPIIKRFYLDQTCEHPHTIEALDFFLRRRTRPGKLLLRPYLVKLAYEIAGGKEWRNIIRACAAMEILNISTYQSNLSFDGKSRVLSSETKNSQFIASMISLALCIEAILSMRDNFDTRRLNRIVKLIHQTNSEIYSGQHLDLNRLNCQHLDLRLSLDEYTDMYVDRCEKIGGALIAVCCQIGAILANGSERILEQLLEIGLGLGVGGQILNDIADFIPPIMGGPQKDYQDCYTDIRAGKITYPVFFLLKQGNEKERKSVFDILNEKNLDSESLLRLTKSLCTSGAIDSTKGILAERHKSLKKKVRELPSSESRYLLELVINILIESRYLTLMERCCRK